MSNSDRVFVDRAEKLARSFFEGDATGHDWYHTHRVRNTAVSLAEKEDADLFVCEMAALLHDVADDKFYDEPERGMQFVQSWLEKENVPKAAQIIKAIETVSFKGGTNRAPDTIEGRVVQDADRLDAIGATGIARCFMYAGAHQDPMHVPELPPRTNMTEKDYRTGKSTAINHFYEKLLTLKERMQTVTGKRMAQERHAFLETFLDTFADEWNGKK
ncbi:phosphohydrolase [Alteribacter lacisalsi]|uniref:Phosphohydrolase n=1 Tax=Alteribacter lacisalsi TaxID=2045244 RepID=A0A2W0HBG7_9BACI|nr:HD domain-containing protein [Alteribacter lacisalsi]PYZ98166.1 phosphohydrolase [Alteribacter lacisalsi]